MPDDKHIHLITPGPVEVRREILDAQGEWMIGHRQPAFAELFASLQGKLKKAFFTESRVYVLAASGTGMWEAAIRNGVRDDKKVLHLTNGAFSERWAQVSEANGKQVDIVSAEWGKAITPEMVEDALKKSSYDAVCLVHNESSTGVLNPVKEIGAIVNEYDDTLFFVDAVSSFAGAELRVDDWGIDVALTSSQKAMSLPPGFALGAVSDRTLERAKQIEHRGYYFDFLIQEKYITKDNTPATPPISLMFAADKQMGDILNEGMESRWDRHLVMRDRAIEWAEGHGFSFYAEDGYRSPTLTAVSNTIDIDVFGMAAYLLSKGYAIDTGYGKLKGKIFRIAHMGDLQMDTLETVLGEMDTFIKS